MTDQPRLSQLERLVASIAVLAAEILDVIEAEVGEEFGGSSELAIELRLAANACASVARLVHRANAGVSDSVAPATHGGDR